jgi:cell division septation protein DedD
VRSSRERRSRGGGLGWIATFGGAAVLLAFGFGIGLVAGSALEAPGLVAHSLKGDGVELPLPEGPAVASRPPPAAPAAAAPAPEARRSAPLGPGERPSDFDTGEGREAPAPVPERVGKGRAAPAAPSPPAVAAPPPALPSARRAPGFAVQVGAFSDRRKADRLAASLRSSQLSAYVVEGGKREAARYRVRVGPYATRERANDAASGLQAKRRLSTWVIAEESP